jgi:N-acetylmuramoyl-L-alanine amidase
VDELAKVGDVGAIVTETITSLSRLGLLNSSEVAFTKEVVEALRAFQQSRGLTATGKLTRDVYLALEEARWRLGDRNLSYIPGALIRGDDIATLQNRLNEMGFSSGRVDGIYGVLTEGAVIEFQKSVGLPADGVCGPATFTALIRLTGTVKGGLASSLRDTYLIHQRGPALAGKIIAIDASFGGDSLGAQAFGLNEAQITYDVAKRLEGRLSALGVTVFMTRGKDNNPSELDRINFANKVNCDLLISLHLDSSSSPNAHGVATYYYGNATHEIHSVVGERFALLAQREICARTDLLNCRAHGKSWEILRLTKAPSVRIDLGYLSNEGDAQRLAR